MAYCERQGLLPDHLASQIDRFCSRERLLTLAGDAGPGLSFGELDAPRGGSECLLGIASEHYLVCVGIAGSASAEPPHVMAERLQDAAFQNRMNVGYGALIRLRRQGLL